MIQFVLKVEVEKDGKNIFKSHESFNYKPSEKDIINRIPVDLNYNKESMTLIYETIIAPRERFG